ncbi:hypothetical protein DPMN_104865 [Dreissena polymorpha]|uniref:Uncharacterized protein n=1 Tax=Dreissena polymorpha TaxID=45954 RepID=A0A9D4HAS6_DREPO|nr:hypothetical protein DPMN_104865 [Dreissena polymorpha]
MTLFKSTRTVIECAVSVNNCSEKTVDFLTKDVDKGDLDKMCKFYPAARKTDGMVYTKNSMLSNRYGLQKIFEKPSVS